MKNPFQSGFSLRTRPAPAPTPAKAADPIGLKEIEPGEAEGVGIVKGVNAGDEYGGSLSRAKKKLARVTVQFGEDPPELTKKQEDALTWDQREQRRPPSSSFDVPPGMARGLAIGDRVRVSIEKVGE